MAITIKNTSKFLIKTVLTALSIVLILSAVGLVALQGFVFWINSDKGDAWITKTVNNSLQESGYSVALKNFSVGGIFGLKAAEMHLYQGDVMIAEGRHVSLSVNPAGLGVRHLDLSLNAQLLALLHSPERVQEDAQESATEVTLPDLYFKTAQAKIDIHEFRISENVIEGGFQTHLQVRQNIDLRGIESEMDGWVTLKDIHHAQGGYFPEKVTNKLRFNAVEQEVIFDEITVERPNYDLRLDGRYALMSAVMDAVAQGEWRAPEDANYALSAPVSFEAKINGLLTKFEGDAELKTAYDGADIGLNTKILRDGALVKFDEINGYGGELKLAGDVGYDLDTSLATGEIKAALADLQFIKHLMPEIDLRGAANATISLSAKDDLQRASIDSVIDNFGYQDYTADKIVLSAEMHDVRDIYSTRGDVTVSNAYAAGIDIPKAVIDIVPAVDHTAVKLDMSGKNINAFTLKGDADVRNFNPIDVALSRATLKAGSGVLNVSGSLVDNVLDFKIDGRDLDPKALPFADLSNVPLRIDSVKGEINGTLAGPRFNFTYDFHPTTQKQFGSLFSGETVFENGQLNNTLNGRGRGLKNLEGYANLPLNLALQPFAFDMPATTPLDAKLKGQIDLDIISSLFMDDGYTLSGIVDADTRIFGPLNSLEIGGSAAMNDGLFIDRYNDIELHDINIDAQFSNRDLEIITLSARDKNDKGTITAKAKIGIEDFSNPYLDVTLNMNDMHLLTHENYDGWLNADLRLQGSGERYDLNGTISPSEISIRIPSTFDKKIPKLNIIKVEGEQDPTDVFLSKVYMDLNFKADDRIFVSGWGLDAELAGNLEIEGTAHKPLVQGQLSTIRGRYEEFGRRFDLDRAVLRFQGAVPPSPYLDIEAVSEIEDIAAKIQITGSVENPDIKLASTPSLPEDEVLSLILFGKDVSKISAFQAIQLARTLRKFSGQGGDGFDPLHSLQEFTGLDDIRVDGAGTDDTTVGAGKYISDKVYLDVEQGTATGSTAASVEIEVTPNITVESKASQTGESDVGVFWEWSY